MIFFRILASEPQELFLRVSGDGRLRPAPSFSERSTRDSYTKIWCGYRTGGFRSQRTPDSGERGTRARKETQSAADGEPHLAIRVGLVHGAGEGRSHR